jgi:hypothetical protein
LAGEFTQHAAWLHNRLSLNSGSRTDPVPVKTMNETMSTDGASFSAILRDGSQTDADSGRRFDVTFEGGTGQRVARLR